VSAIKYSGRITQISNMSITSGRYKFPLALDKGCSVNSHVFSPLAL
jgi:hypothetical protein